MFFFTKPEKERIKIGTGDRYKMVQREEKSNTHIRDSSLSWLDTDTSIKSD